MTPRTKSNESNTKRARPARILGTVAAALLVLQVAAPIPALAEAGHPGDEIVAAYWAAVGAPIRERLLPAFLPVHALADDAGRKDLLHLLDLLDEAEAALIQELRAYQVPADNPWKLFAVAEACTGDQSCGGSYNEFNNEGQMVNQTQYASFGSHEYNTCSFNAVYNNVNVGTGDQTFCIVYDSQTATIESSASQQTASSVFPSTKESLGGESCCVWAVVILRQSGHSTGYIPNLA